MNNEELPVVCELLTITGSEEEQLSNLLKKYELQCIALTKGYHGSVLVTQEGTCVHTGVRVDKLVDTVGAGDSFTAALVMGLLHQDSLENIAEQANVLASYVCSQSGAMVSHPIRNNDNKNPLKDSIQVS